MTTQKKLLLLHTTCCYFLDGLHLNAELEPILNEVGVETCHLLTSGGICTYITELDEPRLQRCNHLNASAYQYLTSTKTSVFRLADFVGRVSTDITANWQAKNVSTDLERLEFAGLSIWTIIKGSVAAYLRWDSVPAGLRSMTNSEREIVNEFIQSSINYILAFEDIFDELRPTHVLLFNGMLYLERIAYEVARKRGLSVIATESCCFADRKYFDLAGVVGNRHSFATQAKHIVEAKILTSGQRAKLRSYLRHVYEGRNNFIEQSKSFGESIRCPLRIPDAKPIVTFFAQVPYDSVVVYDSHVYTSVYDAIKATIEIFAKHTDIHLLIRLHPGGPNTGLRGDSTWQQLSRKRLPDNVSVVRLRELNSYDIMRESSLGITICSQAGLEMLSMHKPVIVLGDAFYSHLGFTYDVPNAKLYPQMVSFALDNLEMGPAVKDRIDTYLYYFIFEYLVPVDRKRGVITKEGVQRLVALLR